MEKEEREGAKNKMLQHLSITQSRITSSRGRAIRVQMGVARLIYFLPGSRLMP